MPKRLPLDDFRAVRIILEADDFALSSGEEPAPSDLIEEDVWRGITVLPDDVSIFTSSHNGNSLKILYSIWGAWIDAVGVDQDLLYDSLLDASDEYKASIFNSLNGYYRQAIGCLRNALEQTIIGAYCQVCDKATDFAQWRTGKGNLSFGQACTGLDESLKLKPLNTYLRDKVGDNLFKKDKITSGGWARRLYSELSDYAHTRPGFANVDMWASNGPVYAHDYFALTFNKYLEVSALCFILVKLARPTFALPEYASLVFGATELQRIKVAGASYEFLFAKNS